MSGVATTASKSRKPPLNLGDQVIITDDVGAGLGGLGGLRATGEHEDLGGLTSAVRQVDGTTHELVGLARVNAQTEHSLDGLVEVVGGACS